MYPKDYKGYTTLQDIVDPDTGRRSVVLKVSRKADECPECGGTKIYKQQKARHAMLDITEVSDKGQLVEVHLIGERCQCQDCKKTFVNWPPFIHFKKNTKVTDDVLNYVVKKMTWDRTSILENAGLIGVSPKIISDALNREIERTNERINTYLPVEQLFLMPATFRRKQICVIGGIEKNGTKVLFDVVDSYDQAMIHNLIGKCYEYAEDYDYVHAKLNSDILKDLHVGFRHSIIVVLVDCIRNLITSSKTDTDGLYSQRCDALNSLRSMLNSQNSKTFTSAFGEWWDNLIDGLRPSLQFLYDTIRANIKEISDALDVKEYQKAFQDELLFVSSAQKKNFSFAMLRYFLLCKSDSRYSHGYPAFIIDNTNEQYEIFNVRLDQFNSEIEAF